MRVRYLGGRTIEQYASPNIGGQMTGHRGSVLHIAQGTYRGTIAWQMNPDQRYRDGTRVTTSSTWIVGRNDGEWAQMADTDRIAWCQRSGSLDWLSIELAGYAPQAPTAWQIWACAQLLGLVHREYGVPLRVTDQVSVRGLGHHSMDNDTTVQWGHDSCPGTGVIGAKPAIVNLAVAQSEGADMTPEQAKTLADIAHVTVTRGKTSDGSWFTIGLESLLKTVLSELDTVKGMVADLAQNQIAAMDVDQVTERLYNSQMTPGLTREEIKAALQEGMAARRAGMPRP